MSAELIEEVRRLEVAVGKFVQAQHALSSEMERLKKCKLGGVDRALLEKYSKMKKLLIAMNYKAIQKDNENQRN